MALGIAPGGNQPTGKSDTVDEQLALLTHLLPALAHRQQQAAGLLVEAAQEDHVAGMDESDVHGRMAIDGDLLAQLGPASPFFNTAIKGEILKCGRLHPAQLGKRQNYRTPLRRLGDRLDPLPAGELVETVDMAQRSDYAHDLLLGWFLQDHLDRARSVLLQDTGCVAQLDTAAIMDRADALEIALLAEVAARLRDHILDGGLSGKRQQGKSSDEGE